MICWPVAVGFTPFQGQEQGGSCLFASIRKVLGLRLVKKSINQDDPGTYHLFYADAEGRPGTDLTFFPWESMAPARKGTGLAAEVQLAVPQGSLAF